VLGHDSRRKAREPLEKVLPSDMLGHDSLRKARELLEKVLPSDVLTHDSHWKMHPLGSPEGRCDSRACFSPRC